MKTFGVYLKELGAISASKFEEATQSQVVFGGRLGTNLVELGYLSLAEIGRHLSDYLDVPVAPKEWIDFPSSEALATISEELAAKHCVLPLHLEKRKLHLAMLDPRDPIGLDEIAFATGLRVVPYVVPEVRLLAMLEHRYGIRRELRYINLGREAAQGRQVSAKPDSGAAGAADATTLKQVASTAHGVKEQSHDLIDETTFSLLHQVRAASTQKPEVQVREETTPQVEEVPIEVADLERPTIVVPRRALSIAALEAELLGAPGRDAVSECTLRLARRFCAAAALFVVRGEIISGYRGDGDPVQEQISGILLPVESDCAITSPSKSRLPFRGLPPATGLDVNLLDSLGRSGVAEVAVHPILIRGQVVNLLYTDAGSEKLGDTHFAAVEVVARLASAAYERLILEAKASAETS